MKKKIVIFISGNGSNALNIINYSSENQSFIVSDIFCNNQNSKFLENFKQTDINFSLFSNEKLSNEVFDQLKLINPSLIVLAGFLKKIPVSYINYFKKKIINIHPSLLPKYGGKGMFGSKVHNNVISNSDNETGITIHYVSEKYDSGEIIFQKKIKVEKEDTPLSIEKKIHALEYKFYPEIIESLLNDQ